MTRLRAALSIGSVFCGAILVALHAAAQTAPPTAKATDGATLFKQQCGTCHTTNLTDSVRQGPPLSGVVGRPAGKVAGFHYSAAFAKTEFAWDDSKLDAWLANPQELVPGTNMAYRQSKPETRAAIIAYLKELN